MNTTRTARAIIATGAEHTFIGNAVARPTESGLFSRPDFWDGAADAVPVYRFGRGESWRSNAQGTACSVCSTSLRPSLCTEHASDGLQSRHGATAMQSQSPTTPAAGIVFSLTTTGRWNGSQIKDATDNLRLSRDGCSMVLVSRDTGKPLAVLRYDGFKSATGMLKRIDVELCAVIELGMGAVVVATLEAVRDELDDCAICTPDGVEMVLSELQAAADAIDASAAQSIEASRPKPQRLPDGSMRIPGVLSFMHTTTTPRGRWLSDCHFHAEPMTHDEGQREGMRMAGEFLSHVRANKTRPLPVTQIIAAALGCEVPSPTWAKPSTANVSRAFLDVLVEMVEAAAQHIDHESFIKRVIARSLEDEKDAAEWERARHQKAAVKAQATRKARRAAKAAA